MSTGSQRVRMARELATCLALGLAPPPPVDPAQPLEEDNRTRWRRRLQQRRCIACGARDILPYGAYFCAIHQQSHRYCSTCETLREVAAHGKDSRCKSCAAQRALARYHAYPDANLYRLRLKELSKRSKTRADQIFDGIRRRIALATFVRQTPGLTWKQRGEIAGVNPKQLEASYYKQIRDDLKDADYCDQARNRVLIPR